MTHQPNAKAGASQGRRPLSRIQDPVSTCGNTEIETEAACAAATAAEPELMLLSGNEAIARGAWEAGCHIGSAYPGTPSTETMEAFGTYPEVYAEWAPNEKVAFEVAVGASAAGARVLTTMKHVGVNVAADPLYSASYTGVGGGLVIMAADDPGMHSSQNEQDSRYHALASRIPSIDPADSQEALEFTREAFAISERFDTPVMVRSTVRISHGKTLVEVGEREDVEISGFASDPAKWVMMPAYAKGRRHVVDERDALLASWVEKTPLNRIEMRDTSVGFVCAGAVYQHLMDAAPEASVLKLGVTNPLPKGLLETFRSQVDKLYVLDEGSDYLSRNVRALGIDIDELPGFIPPFGELSPRAIRVALGLECEAGHEEQTDLPPRPPALCPGCPHRLVFKELSRMKAIVSGDIGCYTLGALPPLSAMDLTVDMGASISMAHGMRLAGMTDAKRPVVAVIGDSTFAHSGVTSLMNTVYNRGAGVVCILDNRTTAMTGRQGNPFNGVTLQGRPSRETDIVGLVRALGVDDVKRLNPHDAREVRRALRDAAKSDELSVLVFESPCVLLERTRKPQLHVNERCTACGACISIGCPALSKTPEGGYAKIDPLLCVGCGQCAQYCGFGAIDVPGDPEDNGSDTPADTKEPVCEGGSR